MHITPRLSVEGPDKDGDYEIIIDGNYYERVTRAEADALIAALQIGDPVKAAFVAGWDAYRDHMTEDGPSSDLADEWEAFKSKAKE